MFSCHECSKMIVEMVLQKRDAVDQMVMIALSLAAQGWAVLQYVTGPGGAPFRWQRKAEAASGDSNWTQRMSDVWPERVFSFFLIWFLLCGTVGVSQTESVKVQGGVCLFVHIDLRCNIWSFPHWSFIHTTLGLSRYWLPRGLQPALRGWECADSQRFICIRIAWIHFFAGMPQVKDCT